MHRFDAGNEQWPTGPSALRGADSATGPRPLGVIQEGADQDEEARSLDKAFRPLEFEESVAPLDGGVGGRQRFEWNLIRNADGTLTKVYYFRTEKPGVDTYVELMKRFVPGFAGLRAGDDYVVHAKYLRDPRPGNPDTWKGTGNFGLPTGAVDSVDLLMVTASEFLLRQTDAFLQSVLADMPQVELEVTIVEITMDDQLDVGLNIAITRGSEEDPESNLFDMGVISLAKDLVSGAFGSFSAIHDESVINGLLELLQSTTASNVLSSPKLAVLNGHRAVIDTGFETPTFTPKFSASGLTTIQTRFEPTGIRVVVTPFILGDGIVQLEIAIEASNVTGFVTAGIGSGAEVQNPLIAQRNAYTVVNVPSGQSVLIGGLVTTEEIETVDKVPLLGDIPWFGALFRRTTTSQRRAQVLFLVQPTIDAVDFRPGTVGDPARALEN